MSTFQNSVAPAVHQASVRRFWEIDALRGVAIVMMVIFHLVWDLWFFRVLPDIILFDGFWKYFQRTTATLFILLVGVSLTVSYHRVRAAHPDRGIFRRYLIRGLKIFGLGMAISVVVSAAGIGYIHFGVLHLIGFSIVAAHPFLPFRWLNLVLWLAFFAAGDIIRTIHVDTVWLAWLGLTPVLYAPNDYFPVIPWFGVVLLGVFFGNTLYPDGNRRLRIPDLSMWLPVRFLDALGRHSLLIYLVHQPVLIAILVALGIIHLPGI